MGKKNPAHGRVFLSPYSGEICLKRIWPISVFELHLIGRQRRLPGLRAINIDEVTDL